MSSDEVAARYLACLHSEALRLFGDKSGRLEDLLPKVARQVGPACMARAMHAGEPEPEPSTLAAALSEHHDKQARRNFGKRRHRGRVVLHYLTLIQAPGISTGAWVPANSKIAVRETAKAFQFQTAGACYKELQRAGVKGLYSTR